MEAVAERFVQWTESAEIYTLTGEFDLLVKFILGDHQESEQFVLSGLQKVDGVVSTMTLETRPWFM